MGMMATWMMLLVMLTQGSGGDLLDQVSTDAYWQSKSVTVTPQTMREAAAAGKKADVSREIAQLSSADADQRVAAMKAIIAAGPGAIPQLEELAASTDPKLAKLAANLSQQIKRRSNDGAVRQLMAIRALGELGDKESLPMLNGLLASKEAFVADYAAAAIAKISGKPLTRAESAPADRQADLKLLPGNCGLVAQVSLAGGAAGSPAASPRKQEETATTQPIGRRASMDRQMISLAEMVGNVSLTSLTLGVGEEVGPAKGFVVLVARGKFDRATVADLLIRQGGKPSLVSKTTVYTLHGSVRVILADDGRVILLAGPTQEQLPVDAVVASLEGGPGGLQSNPAMTRLLGTVDQKLPVWAVARMTDGYKAIPLPPMMPVPFESLSLTGQRSGGVLKLHLQGVGIDPAAVQAAAQAYQELLAKAVAELQRSAERKPLARVVRDLFMGISVQVKDKDVTLDGELRVDEVSAAGLMRM